MLTEPQLRSIMPALAAKKSADFFPLLSSAMTEFAIETPARAAAFLAQLAHESGQFRFMEEIWGPTPAQRRYEPPGSLATALGNTEPGDGRLFKGRGPIQITGRANYRRFGDLLGVPLETDPARAAAPNLAFRIAGLFWSKNQLNELADLATADAFRAIAKRINGGLNGLADREQFYATARTVLGVGEAQSRGMSRGGTSRETLPRGNEAIRSRRRAPLRQRRSGTLKPIAPRTAGARKPTARSGGITARKKAGTPQETATRKGSVRPKGAAALKDPTPIKPPRRQQRKKPMPAAAGRTRK